MPRRREGTSSDRRSTSSGELGFEPAVSATGPPTRHAAIRRRRPAPHRPRRPRAPAARRGCAVASPRPSCCSARSPRWAAATPLFAADVRRRRHRDQRRRHRRRAGSCTETAASPATARTCRASQGRGPSLIGVGGAAVYFQVSTGRMPAAEPGRQRRRARTPKFTEEQTRAARRLRRSRSAAARRSRPATLRGDDAEHRRGRRAVPAQLRVLPRHHRQGRAAVGRQGRAVAERGHRHADLHGDAVRPGEHAGLQRQPDHPGRRSRRSSPTSRR